MNNYWIITQLFFPDETSTGYVMTKIAETLTSEGQVNVICASPDYQSKNLNSREKLNERINVIRIKTPAFNKNKLLSRVFLFLSFSFLVLIKILFKVKKNDTIVLVTNPPTLLIIIGMLKKIFGFKLFVILQDIFPENAAASGILNKDSIGYRLILKTMNLGYKNADKLIACGTDMARHFIAKGIVGNRIFVIPNWADHELITPNIVIDRSDYFKYKLDGKIVLLFAGNIGRLQGLEYFIKLFGKCKNEQLILIIIGDGAHKKLLENLVDEFNLKNVLFFDSKPRIEQNIFLNSCDIGLITLCEGMYGLGVPSKVYNVMSAGKPILFIGDKNSEIDNYIRDNNVGWSYDWSEESKILDFLNNVTGKENFKKIGQDARSFVLNNFTQEIILNQYKKILNE